MEYTSTNDKEQKVIVTDSTSVSSYHNHPFWNARILKWSCYFA